MKDVRRALLMRFALVFVYTACMVAGPASVLPATAADPLQQSPTAGSYPANLVSDPQAADEQSVLDKPAKEVITVIDNSNKQTSDWAAADVDWMVSNHIVPPQLQYNYTSYITREEFAELAVSVVNFMSEGTINFVHTTMENPFQDSANSEVAKAYSYGIVNGVSDTEFKPKQSINRQEAAMMMSNLLQSIQAENLSTGDFHYPDRDAIAGWALDAVDVTSNVKLFQGTDQGFRPQDYYTREQAIAVMRRLLNYEGQATVISLRGRVVLHLRELGTTDEAKANKAGPVSALVGTSSVKFLWTERLGTAEAYLAKFKAESDHQHAHAASFSPKAIEQLESGQRSVRDGEYVIELGSGTQKTGFLLQISW
ncbi:S-layer homology domain-containing protein [Paenibacillus athensensis]|uniref:SLH domain-containing protein n=1 Tax=Paenibacillus athensensis TaxID=1967502 RepID=A0A4Y8Q6B5_9BACL|nr:S-layer homology domain-containing protein [Paenibacillus athensensis]MCD1259552.1 S-layer homology domain-containing protein [Paenibacillus athensensis]